MPWNSSGGSSGPASRGGGWGGGGALNIPSVVTRPKPPKSKGGGKKDEGGSHFLGVPLLHAGHVPWEMFAAPVENVGEKILGKAEKTGKVPHLLGSILHRAAHVAYVGEEAIPRAVMNPYKTATQAAGMTAGLAELPYAFAKSQFKSQVAGPLRSGNPVAIGKLIGKVLDPATAAQATLEKGVLDNPKKTKHVAAALLYSTLHDYGNRTGPQWRKFAEQEPLNNLLDVTSVLGGGFRAASAVSAAARLAAEGEVPASKVAAMLGHTRAVWKESGNFPDRVMAYETPEGKTITSTQAASHSPLRAHIQMASDRFGNKYTNVPLVGAQHRVTRAKSLQITRAVSRAFGGVPGLESLGRLNDREAARAYWGGSMGDYSAASLRRLRDVMKNEYDQPFVSEDANFQDLLHKAKQEGFGPGLLKNVDLAIKHAEAEPDLSPRMQAAIKGLEHATQMAQETSKETHVGMLQDEIDRQEGKLKAILSNGPVTDADAVAKVEQRIKALTEQRDTLGENFDRVFSRRLNLVRDWVDHGTKVTSPIRDGLLAGLTKHLGEKQATEAVALSDQMAVRTNPFNPEKFYENRIGDSVFGESATSFVKRLKNGDADALMQYDIGPLGGDKAHLYSSPLTKAVDAMPSKRMQVAQLLGYLRKAGVIPEEMLHTGVTHLLEGKTESDFVYKTELQALIDSPENAFQLVTHHWVNNGVGERPPFMDFENGGVLSRTPETGEYHHWAVGLPESASPHYGAQIQSVGGNITQGSGWLHHGGVTGERGRTNIAAHVRAHIYRDERDGRLKLLIEEVQSDWDSDARKQASERGAIKEAGGYGPGKLTPEEAKRLATADDEKKYLLNEMDSIDQKIGDAQEAANAAMSSGERQAFEDEAQAGEAEYQRLLGEADQLEQEIVRLQDKQIGRLVPSPLGKDRWQRTLANHISQFAHEHGVDDIIVTDGPTQTMRNLHYGRDGKPGFNTVDWKQPHSEIAASVRENFPRSKFSTLYERDFPKELSKALGGAPGKHDPEAYIGQFRNAYHRTSRSDPGPMGGTVFKLGEDTAKATEQTRALYQAAKRGRLPRGATEFLKDGTTAIKLFKNADISTWVHELAHVALHDLPEEHLKLLEKHFGGGKSFKDWTEAEHEDYAQSFERYLATGDAPNRMLEATFSKIAAWMQRLWKVSKEEIPDIHPEVRQAFDAMFHGHDQPTIFFPHRADFADFVGGTQGVVRANRDIGNRVMTAAGSMQKNTLALLRSGTLNPDPRLAIENLSKHMALARANQLRRTVGLLSQPITSPMYEFNPETQYLFKKAGTSVDNRTLDALENAENPGQVRDTIESLMNDFITSDPNVAREWQKHVANVDNELLHVVDKKTVDRLFENVTGRKPGAATKPSTTAHKVMDALLDSVRGMLLYSNPGFYVANMVGNAGMMTFSDPRAARYFQWSMKNATRNIAHGEKVDPLWHRLTVEMGRGPMSGNLSQDRRIPLSDATIRERAAQVAATLGERGRARRGAEGVSKMWGNYGRASGNIIDDSFRVATWRQVARKRGYSTPEQITKLLDDGVRDSAKHGLAASHTKALRDLNSIRDEAEQLMLDFDSMTPFEKQWMTKSIFLYPFMKASAKYPFMYAGERPLVTGIGGQAALQAGSVDNQYLGQPSPFLPKWMEGYARTPWGYAPVSSISPLQPLIGMAEAFHQAPAEAELGVQRPSDYFNPMYQMVWDMMQQQNKFGKSTTPWNVFKQEVPLPAYLKQALHLKQPGQIYVDRSELATLERAFRLPFKIRPDIAAKEYFSGR